MQTGEGWTNARWSGVTLSLLRVMAALLFMQHGLQKMFHFPPGGHHPGPFVLFSLTGLEACLETFGGGLLAIGLFTRPVAFLLSGEMAVAYFTVHIPVGLHMPGGFFPVVNGGDLAILFCFVFLHLCVTGPGPFSVDALISRAPKAG